MVLVTDVAARQRLSVRRALDLLVDDALMSKEAESEQAQGDGLCSRGWASARALSRQVTHRVLEEPNIRAPATDEELEWRRVVHAVVLRDSGSRRERAQEVAESVLLAVAGARDETEFEARANRVPHDGVRFRVERVPEFDANGVTQDGAPIDPGFVAAALRLRIGETSGVVESSFGWHVLRLEGLRAGPPLSQEQRAALEHRLVEMRARGEVESLLARLRHESRAQVAPGLDELLARAYAAAEGRLHDDEPSDGSSRL